MSRVNSNCVIARMNKVVASPNLFMVLMPFHFGGIYAYLSGNIGCGIMVTIAFLMLRSISK